jgi:predicted ABC-type ATPase
LPSSPELIAIAGPNGAGKSTFYEAFLADTGPLFVNADVIALQTGLGAYQAAALAESLRRLLVRTRTSFVFETVFRVALRVTHRGGQLSRCLTRQSGSPLFSPTPDSRSWPCWPAP